MSAVFCFLVDKSGNRLDQFLVRKTGHSRAFIQEQIAAGRVLRNRAVVSKASQKLKAGDEISGQFRQEPSVDLVPVPYPLELLFEDESFLVVNKPQGMVVHPAAGHRGETLVHHLLHHLQRHAEFSGISPTRPGIVHRLDRGTSGVIVVAKTRPVQEALSRKFKQREMKKEYEAIAWGKVKAEGTFHSVIGRDKKDRKKMSSRTLKGREASTTYRRLTEFKHFSHVALFPKTGRTHQLRVHLSESGNPIVGDALYGRGSRRTRVPLLPSLENRVESVKYPFLHARRLDFEHPVTGKAMRLEASRPREFDEMLDCLRKVDL